MATVYLARDRKHNRELAVKILHPHLAANLGPERFLREIQIAASLNHPHILTLIDSGEAGGYLYYVVITSYSIHYTKLYDFGGVHRATRFYFAWT